MPPPIPRCSSRAYTSLASPSHFSLPRYGSRVGLHIVLFEACSAFTRVAACTLALSPIRDTLIEGFSHFVTSMTAPIASCWSDCRVGLHPLESAAFARRAPRTDSRTAANRIVMQSPVVGGEQRARNGNANRSGGVSVDASSNLIATGQFLAAKAEHQAGHNQLRMAAFGINSTAGIEIIGSLVPA